MLGTTFIRDPKTISESVSISPNHGEPGATSNHPVSHVVLRLYMLAGVGFLAVALLPLVSLAHTSGASFEINTGDHLIDIGHSPERIDEKATILFDFDLLNATTGAPAEYDYVWLKIQQGEETMLATGIGKPASGPLTLLYRPVQAGNHDMHVRFQQDDAVVAEGEAIFAVTAVDTSSQTKHGISALLLAAGAVVGGGVVWARMRIGKNRKDKHV